MTLSVRARGCLVGLGLLVLATGAVLLTMDTKTLRRSWLMLSALRLGQVVEILGGPGEAGVLADGGDSPTVTLEDGTEVPRSTGTQPLVPHPPPPPPKPGNPNQRDE